MSTAITEKAQAFVRDLFENQQVGSITFHTFNRSMEVASAVSELAGDLQLSEEEQDVLNLAALFYNTGFTQSYSGAVAKSQEIARSFLEQHDYPEDCQAKVLSCIQSAHGSSRPATPLEEVFHDAVSSYLGSEDYLAHLGNLRAELENNTDNFFGDEEWFRKSRNDLRNHQFCTDAAYHKYGPQKKSNDKALKKALKKIEKVLKPLKKGTTELAPPTNPIGESRTAQMMFKTALRNHIDLTNIADNKANIMLSINAIVITISMPLLATNIKGNMFLIVPSSILLLTCVLTIIFATMATRPIKMMGSTDLSRIREGRHNLFFFGNFYKMSNKDYQQGLKTVLHDEEILESSIINDLYYLGAALGNKYSKLRICYNIFMIGVTTTVVAFVIAFLSTM